MGSPISEQALMTDTCKRWWLHCPYLLWLKEQGEWRKSVPPLVSTVGRFASSHVHASCALPPVPGSVGGGEGVEHPHIKVGVLKPTTRPHWQTHPTLHRPGCWLRPHWVGQMSQAVDQAQHTPQCILLWVGRQWCLGLLYVLRMETHHLRRRVHALHWSCCHIHIWKADEVGSSYTVELGHHKRLICGVQNRALWGGEWRAKWKLLSPLPGPRPSEVCLVVVSRSYLVPPGSSYCSPCWHWSCFVADHWWCHNHILCFGQGCDP